MDELQFLDKLADFLDNRFRIPFTRIRFGMDALIGLVPYVGDVFTFLVSGILVVVLVRKGASGMLGVKMVGNILLDGVVGSVPLLGDLFDIRYKANYRNVQLMKEHYAQGKHGGSAWWVIFLILGALLLMLFLSIYVVGKLLWWIFS
jgi:hypothetical protein